MRAALMSLKEYQDVLTRIAELSRLLSKVPPEIVQLESELKAIQSRIAELQTRKVDQDKKQTEQRNSLEEAKQQAQKFEKDLHEVTNNKEYHAVLKEIDLSKKKINSLEEDIDSRAKELKEIADNMDECKSLEKESRKKYNSAVSAHSESLTDYKSELDLRSQEREKLTSQVPDSLMRKFERISGRRSGTGLSMCVGGVCQACNVRVRQNVVDELRKFTKVISCESCKRILIFSDDQ